MNKIESKIKEFLEQESEKAPDYWENISKKTNIPYNGRMIMKKTPKRNIFRLRYVVPAVCGLALVAILSIVDLPGNKPTTIDNKVINNQEVTNLHVNNIISSMASKIRMPENGTTKEISYEDYLENNQMDLELWLPSGLENTGDAYVYYNEDGTEFMMSGYTYGNGNTEAYINIRFQKDNLPMSDTRYQLEDQEVSTINGEEVVIGYSKELDAYFTSFLYNGMGYEVTGIQGISQDDFISVVKSIIQ